MTVKSIKSRISNLRAVGVAAVGFPMRHRQMAAAVVAGVLILTPMLTGSPEVFLLNLAGLGLAILVARKIAMAVRRRGRRGKR